MSILALIGFAYILLFAGSLFIGLLGGYLLSREVTELADQAVEYYGVRDSEYGEDPYQDG